jgi:hypothetical protein
MIFSYPPMSAFIKGGKHGYRKDKKERILSFIKRGEGRLLNKNPLFICLHYQESTKIRQKGNKIIHS